MRYNVWESHYRWQWLVGKGVSKRKADKLVAECPVGRHRWIDPYMVGG